MMMRFLLLALAILSSTAMAQVVPCAVLEANWYKFYTKYVNVRWDTRTFDCPSGEALVAQAFYDIHDISYYPGAGGYTPDFWLYVRTRIKSVGYDENCTAMAYQNAQGLTVCPAFFNTAREDKASTLVHEARHCDSDDPRHANCVGGAHNGDIAACDDQFYGGDLQGSGFNADVFFLGWSLARKDNDLSREVIRSFIKSYVPDRFNKITPEQITAWRSR